MNRDDFITVGAFVQEFKKKARKVSRISKEAQCAIFLGLFTASEVAELTSHGGGSAKLTWATIDKGVEEGGLDQVEQYQMRLQRRKRKERDATASGTPGVKRIVTDVLAELGYGKDVVVQKKVVMTVQGKGKASVVEEVDQEEWEEDEPVSQHLTKAQRKLRNLTQGGQGTGKGQVPQALAATPASTAAPSNSAGPSQGGAPPYGQWSWPVINAFVPWGSLPPAGPVVPYVGPQASMPPPSYPAAQAQPTAPPPSPTPSSQGSVAGGGNQGQGNQENAGTGSGRGQGRNGSGRGGQWDGQGQGNQGGQGYGRPRFDWKTAICQHCDKQRHTIRFRNARREDERTRLIYSNMDEDIYDQFGEYIDRKVPCGVRAEALRRIAARQAPPATFRLWQGSDDPPIRVEEMEGDEEEGGAIEDTPPVDGFLDQEENIRLHINEWSPRVPSCVGHPIWHAPRGYEQKAELALKPFEEEDHWGGKDVQWMMKLALAGKHSLVEKIRTIEEGPDQVKRHEELMGGMYLLLNALLQGTSDPIGSLNPAEEGAVVPENEDDEFEEGEIKEVFRAEEYDGIYLELGFLLSCEMRTRDASERAQRMKHLYLVTDGHLFVKTQMVNPRRVVCRRNRQIDVIVALHDGIAKGHR
ncbi:hypothetical protein CBR_g40999 [Chara braunii]|uniref:Uncharacterized protein n=1 Tax=Chara braunii TaxID=69332 RepID=A0A388LUU8_CHABU|nr:hypothetical protein CBR_g40999 [Chara braunii]|eukprot:GBG86097.1 hypothetical protein CBR_g40999 [Chara braunii]